MPCTVQPAGRKMKSPLTLCHRFRSTSGHSNRICSTIQALDRGAGTLMSHAMRMHTALDSSQALKATDG
ncbi:hypothetical protein CesoFtcFv8_015299 [Champsocephalus esox]|uniref:Uncharacterized protein n=1 Tax=Champsocephalus esox TaxID=159716 RepID=A0AAN8GSS6_9TELE|nr:hypothetical protein CesoFtcFv8_015299 [Champsocephalus esox]